MQIGRLAGHLACSFVQTWSSSVVHEHRDKDTRSKFFSEAKATTSLIAEGSIASSPEQVPKGFILITVPTNRIAKETDWKPLLHHPHDAF